MGINLTQYQVLQLWTKCLSSHNWSCESLPQSLQWTKCLLTHNWSCESLPQSLQWTKCLSTHNWSCESLPQSLQWTKCLLNHNWNYESLPQSLQWTKCLSSHNWNYEVSALISAVNQMLIDSQLELWISAVNQMLIDSQLELWISASISAVSIESQLELWSFANIAKDIEGITAGVSFKFNFLSSCSCHACDSELFTYFLLCDFYSTIDNVIWHAHDMLFLMAYSKHHIAQQAAHTVV